MKPLTDSLLELCALDAISVARAGEALGVDAAHVRKAMRRLNEEARADLVRLPGEREICVAPLLSRRPGQRNICPNCRTKFERPPRSKRRTCCRSCAVSLSWKNEASRAARIEAIVVSKSSSEARERTLATNKRRWARPGEREKLSEKNRERWADPATRAKMSRGIRQVQQTPERRELYADIRRRHWDDPEKRAKMEDGIRRSKRTPEARAKFSALLKARWQDPVWRAKYMASAKKNAKLGGAARHRKKKADAP